MADVAQAPIWIGIALTGATLGLGQLAIFVKFSNSVAVNARRLEAMEEWQRTKSIDRGEVEAAEARSHAEYLAISDKLTSEMSGFDTQVRDLRVDLKETTKTLGEVRMEIARIPEQLKRQEEVQGLHHEATKHSLANIKMMVQQLGLAQQRTA